MSRDPGQSLVQGEKQLSQVNSISNNDLTQCLFPGARSNPTPRGPRDDTVSPTLSVKVKFHHSDCHADTSRIAKSPKAKALSSGPDAPEFQLGNDCTDVDAQLDFKLSKVTVARFNSQIQSLIHQKAGHQELHALAAPWIESLDLVWDAPGKDTWYSQGKNGEDLREVLKELHMCGGKGHVFVVWCFADG